MEALSKYYKIVSEIEHAFSAMRSVMLILAAFRALVRALPHSLNRVNIKILSNYTLITRDSLHLCFSLIYHCLNHLLHVFARYHRL